MLISLVGLITEEKMLTKYQEQYNMLTIDNLNQIEYHLIKKDIPDFTKQLMRVLSWRPIYVTEGTYGEIPLIKHLPVPYQNFVDEILKIKSKNTLLYGGEVSLFKLTAYTVKNHDNCYHQVFKLEVNDYLSE